MFFLFRLKEFNSLIKRGYKVEKQSGNAVEHRDQNAVLYPLYHMQREVSQIFRILPFYSIDFCTLFCTLFQFICFN